MCLLYPEKWENRKWQNISISLIQKFLDVRAFVRTLGATHNDDDDDV